MTAERLRGFNDAVPLIIDGLPPGVKVARNPVIPAGQPAVEIAFTADAKAAVAVSRLRVHALSETAVLPAQRGQPETDTVLLAVALPTPFKIVGDYELTQSPRGSVRHRHYRIERGGYDGPIEVSLADRQARHLQGVRGPTIVVPTGVSEFDYPVELPPWMELGRTSRTCIMGVGVVKDGGGEHYVSYSSVQQNDQIIAVVEAGRLGVAVEKPAILAVRGKSVAVAVRVSRDKGLVGPVKVELILPRHLHGVAAEPLVVPAGQSSGVLKVHFADAAGPFNMPLTVRATLTAGDPVVAETKVDVVADE